MADVQIGTLDTTIEFEAEAPVAAAAPQQDAGAGGVDALRLRELLRPLVLEVLEDELARHTRIRG